MRAVKKCFGNTKTLGNNILKLGTNMHLIDDPWCYTASVSVCDVIQLQLVNIFFYPFYTIHLNLASTLVHKQFQVQHVLFHSVVDAADSPRPPRLSKETCVCFLLKKFPQKYFAI